MSKDWTPRSACFGVDASELLPQRPSILNILKELRLQTSRQTDPVILEGKIRSGQTAWTPKVEGYTSYRTTRRSLLHCAKYHVYWRISLFQARLKLPRQSGLARIWALWQYPRLVFRLSTKDIKARSQGSAQRMLQLRWIVFDAAGQRNG